MIEAPTRVTTPRRFDITLEMKGKPWRKIQGEIAPDEGSAGDTLEQFIPPPLSSVGLPSTEALVGLSLRYQVAQKIHVCSDPLAPCLRQRSGPRRRRPAAAARCGGARR